MSNLPQPWRVTASRTIIKDKWIDLRADDCLRADGLEIKPYYVLDYPDWVQVIAIDADENLVVIRQYRHGAGRLTLEIPSGCIDASDADPIAAAARELREETGYAAERLTHVAPRLGAAAGRARRRRLDLIVSRSPRPRARPRTAPRGARPRRRRGWSGS